MGMLTAHPIFLSEIWLTASQALSASLWQERRQTPQATNPPPPVLMAVLSRFPQTLPISSKETPMGE
ncbi:MAG: hypothetical protein ACXW1W_02195 [Methylococcaceae bacterium]